MVSLHRALCCGASVQQTVAPPEKVFFYQWAAALEGWKEAAPKVLPVAEVVLFHSAMGTLAGGGVVVHLHLADLSLLLQVVLQYAPARYVGGAKKLQLNASSLRAHFVAGLETFQLVG